MPIDERELYLALVKAQVDRLRGTYRDFLEQDGYTVLTKFFLEDVYSTHHKAERDEGIKKVYDKFKESVGRDIAENMKKVIHLNDLTDRLDQLMVKKLKEMGIGANFNEDEYEEAYYLTDVYDERGKQIDLILSSLKYFHGLSRYRSIGIALTLMRPYALLKGARALIDFMQEGYRAFRTVGDVSEFETAIRERETDRLDRIYSLGRRPPTIADLRKRAREMGIKGAEKMTLRRMMKEMQRWT